MSVEAKEISVQDSQSKQLPVGVSTPIAPAPKKSAARSRDGIVVSNKMEKTIVVEVRRQVTHAKYGKIVTRNRRFFAHDEKKQCQVGDLVRIVESKPISRLKRWRLLEVLKKAQG